MNLNPKKSPDYTGYRDKKLKQDISANTMKEIGKVLNKKSDDSPKSPYLLSFGGELEIV